MPQPTETRKTFYLTTPIYYVNARPHIGHAYTTIVADVLARRHRLLGDDTFFLTGTDEHGQKIERSAAAAGIPPQQFADQVSASFEALWQRMGITNNDYIRTTEPRHIAGAQKLFSELYARGFIYLASYTGSYCVSDEAFIDAPVGTPCPDCGRLLEEVTEENFFFKLSKFQRPLIDLIESDTIVITPESSKNEVLSFLRGNITTLTASKDGMVIIEDDGSELPLVHWPQTQNWAEAPAPPNLLRVAKSAKGELYIPGTLKDLSISRSSFTWGIPVPEPASSEAKQPHVIYVWLDALANYMTALGYGSDDETLWKKFWPADLHLVGKEITRFHCVYWPAFLLALNPEYPTITWDTGVVDVRSAFAPLHIEKSRTDPPKLTAEQQSVWAKKILPKQITANGWLLFDNSKMSKSKGNVVRTETILDAFGTLCPPPVVADPKSVPQRLKPEGEDGGGGTAEAVPYRIAAHSEPSLTEASAHDRDLFAADILRYYLLREIPFGQDGSFSFEALITRYNADLANGYGNLVSRTLNMVFTSQLAAIPEKPSSPYRCAKSGKAWLDDRVHPMSSDDAFLGTQDVIDVFENLISVQPSLNERHLFDLGGIALRVAIVDRYVSYHKPWVLAKSENAEDKQKLIEVLYTATEAVRILTALFYPYIPYATARVWAQLGLGDIEAAAANGELKNLQWGGLQPGTKLAPLTPIFPRAPKELAQIMTDKETNEAGNPAAPLSSNLNPSSLSPVQSPTTTAPDAGPRSGSLDAPAGTLPVAGSTAHTTGPDPSVPPPVPAAEAPAGPADASPQIGIDDFIKVELRVAQVVVCERIPKADKLLRLEVDLGYERRQILSGIAEWYTPEDMVGRRIIVITNLAPRKMRGLESHGMLLAASEEGGKPFLATVPEGVPVGTRLK